jgi:4-amino-4-deoxy-L-arabinose transferase-like glycosyltransferase
MATQAPARDVGIRTPGARPRPPWAAVLLGAVVLAGVGLRFYTRSDLWLDEALSVNVARLPLSDLHAALRHDGAPPLYYALLHFWIRGFGTGDFASRALSGLLSVATLPLAWFAGRRLGGRRLAAFTLVVVATSPYAIRYGTEARMYSLIMLLVFAGYLAVLRALESASPLRLALVALVTALLIYTQYWCFYLVAVAGALLVVRAVRAGAGPVRRAAQRVIGAIVVGVLTFIPWIPTFAYQARHTGTPWGNARVPWSSTAEALARFAGDDHNGETFILLFALLALAVIGVFGRSLDGRRIELDLRTRPGVRAVAILAFGTLVLGTTLSFAAGSAFDSRYASVMFPFYALVVALGISLFTDPKVRAGVLAVVVLLGLVGGIRNVTTNRTQAGQATTIIAANARPGDVVAYCPDQIAPSASRLLAAVPGLVQLTFADAFGPTRVDWVDYVDRIGSASPAAFASEAVQRAGPHTIWYISAFGFNHVEGKCEGVDAALARARPNAAIAVAQDDSIAEYMSLTIYRG